MYQDQYDQLVTFIVNRREEDFRLLNWLAVNKDLVLAVGCSVTAYGGIQFRKPTRDDTVTIMKAVGGKWDKSYYDASIGYVQIVDKIMLQIDSAPPPPSCKIITEQVLVPAQYVAEHYETRRRIQCTEPKHSPSNSDSQPASPTSPEPVPASVDTVDPLTTDPGSSVHHSAPLRIPASDLPATLPDVSAESGVE